MKLQLIRHAQSTSNVLKILNTRMPGPPLTELGEQQADALADQLTEDPVVAVYCSVATRAQQTAAPVAARHGLEVQVVEGVQEIFVGDLEDRGDQAGIEAYASVYFPWTLGELHLSMPGGESGIEVRDRYLAAVAQIRAKHEQEHPDGTVVLVSHGGAMRLCAELLADNVPPNLAEAGLIPNTGAIVLETKDGGGWHCLAWAGVDQ
ncbi:MAG: histidine phosphatase family protein [Actinophytocola sp.]|nr:histidine phosphatase family protein [Actinophytocola sp.]